MKALQDRLEKRRSREIQKLSSLLQISQALSGTLDLKAAFQDIFETVAHHHDAVRSLLVLTNRETRELTIEAAAGGTRPVAGPIAAGDSVINRVIDSGRQVTVPRVSTEGGLSQILFGQMSAALDEA